MIKLSKINTEAFNYFSDNMDDAIACSELVEAAFKSPLEVNYIIEKIKVDPVKVQMVYINLKMLPDNYGEDELCDFKTTHAICKHFSKPYQVATHLICANVLSYKNPDLNKSIIEYEQKVNPDFDVIEKESFPNNTQKRFLS